MNAEQAANQRVSGASAPDRSHGRRRGAQANRGVLFGYLLLLPAAVIYIYFIIYPLLRTTHFSFTNWDGARAEMTFIGLANYVRMAGDWLFWRAFSNTLIWVFLGTAIILVLSLALAMFVWNRPRGFMFFRTIYFMPQVLPAVVVGIVWVWIYSPVFGILNRSLTAIGLGHLALGWLGDPRIALYAVLAAAVWASCGLAFVIFVAALHNVDGELLDAARIDGANAWQRFRYVVVPQLSHAITLVTVLLLVNGMQAFDHVWIMTRGGPNESTQLLATYAYQKAFIENEVGYGATISVVLAALALVVSIATINLRERGAAAQ